MTEVKEDDVKVITAGSGKSVSLPCSAISQDTTEYVLEWKKEGVAIYTHMNTVAKGHPSMGYGGT